MALKIGITGGIGSGKTTVCHIFAILGVPIYDADKRAKRLMTDNPQLVSSIKDLLGQKAYLPSGALNRGYIANIVFHDQEKLQQLNELVHPAVWKDGEKWHNSQSTAYTLKEAALLFESGGHLLLDGVITVACPEEIRIQRVMKRDGVSREQVVARMSKQWPEAKKTALSQYIIINDGQSLLIPQVLAIHGAILQLNETKKS